MIKPHIKVLLTGLLLAFVFGASQSIFAQQSVFEEAKEKYQFAEYNKATSLFREVANNNQTDVELRRNAYRYLARAEIARGRKNKARSAIKSLVETNPPVDYLDADVEPPAVMNLYYEVQKEKRGDYEVGGDRYKTLAVMDFNNNSVFNSKKYDGLSKGLPSIMINNLTSGTDLQVIERERIEWLLKEIKLQKQKDKVDQSTAVRTGKLMGANIVVFGDFITTNHVMSITARAVEVETGEVIFGDQVKGEPDEFFNLINELSQKVTKSINVEMENTKLGSNQTKSLDAMMAYSDGLSLLEAGKYRKAQRKFKKALEYDSDFQKAKRKMESVRPMVASLNNKK